LYLIITLACGDGEARTLFHESDIGDTDEDGAPEFLDGWGRPIEFIRWAPGFDSEIQVNANSFTGPNDSNWATAAQQDHDPYDSFRVEPLAYRLIPLIYSAGRDEALGVFNPAGYVAYLGVADPTTVAVAPGPPIPIFTPFVMATDPDPPGNTAYLGTIGADGTATDNIHNHLLGER
jgi:hypothetical protein